MPPVGEGAGLGADLAFALAAGFLAGAFLAVAFFAGAFFAGARFAAAFFAGAFLAAFPEPDVREAMVVRLPPTGCRGTNGCAARAANGARAPIAPGPAQR